MLAFDLMQVPSTYLVQISSQRESAAAPPAATSGRAIGHCVVVANYAGASINLNNSLDSKAALVVYAYEFDRKKRIDPKDAKVTFTKFPLHGQILKKPDGLSYYYPDTGYFGKDRAEATVEVAGYRVRVVYEIQAIADDKGNDWENRYCKKGGLWKIADFEADDGNPIAQQHSNDLSSPLTNARQSQAGFQNLPGASLGQTTHQGYTAQITLDTTAAGYGWYINPTPLDNTDDYLPTSNPNLWQAKAGSAAFGKMDMVSVLLHEYGHALGLEHSADAGDFMAATLQPSRPGAGFSALPRGRLRGSRYGGWTPEFNRLQMPDTAPQFDIAAHPALVNAQLTGATGCED